MNTSPTIVVVIVTVALCLPFLRMLPESPFAGLPQVNVPSVAR